MSTDLLYHAFGICGYTFERDEYREGNIIIYVKQEADTLRCPACGSKDFIRKGVVLRRFRTVPVASNRVYLILPIQRVACRACGVVRQGKILFADERRSRTRSFERYALELSRFMTLQDVAHHLGVSWDVIKEIQKRHLRRRYAVPPLQNIRLIAIDEISIGKGYRFLTVVLDLLTGAVVFVGKGKGEEGLIPFWSRLKASLAHIKAVAIDMAAGYIAAVMKHLPDAAIVFDHFHVVKLFNEKLSEFRRALYHEVKNIQQKTVLKVIRWLLLKNPENLDPRRGEHERLEEAQKLNQPLATV